ncbi:hypothetical protein [Levyella massiliensis]|uniref:hypothetical protein n=1 Tax=Levyella massiliensis TaxID=938289 RepID=UPI0024AD93C2|nr:hypothetical protein [Levyella massiliensis]
MEKENLEHCSLNGDQELTEEELLLEQGMRHFLTETRHLPPYRAVMVLREAADRIETMQGIKNAIIGLGKAFQNIDDE